MATYAVGDIQGCLSDLYQLLNKIGFNREDCLWAAGDLVNRGPNSLETLRFFFKLGDRAKIVLGNHDLHLLACWHGARRLNRKDTFNEILNAPDRDQLLHWLQRQPLLYSDKQLNYTMVHAGVPPIWNLDEALSHAHEVENTLRGDHARDFFQHMYGNKPTTWLEGLDGFERLRVITNYFTRMRFCNTRGELELESKCGPESPPEGFKAWYLHPEHRCINEQIIFGHWATMMGNTGIDNFIGLDTGCIWGGYLTALRLEDGARFQSECC